jgi:hypothetical protein
MRKSNEYKMMAFKAAIGGYMYYSGLKTDCFWLDESKDMGATLYLCDHCKDEDGWYRVIHECQEDCNKYITREKAKAVILSWLENNGN